MFRGNYEHSLDPKGRVSIPSKFREILLARGDGRLVVTNFSDHLMAYPFDEWRAFEERMTALSFVKDEEAAFVRYLVSGAVDCELDRQGRILIPPVLRESAGLEAELIIAGVLRRFEIWDRKRWADERRKTLDNFNSIKGALNGLGL